MNYFECYERTRCRMMIVPSIVDEQLQLNWVLLTPSLLGKFYFLPFYWVFIGFYRTILGITGLNLA